MMKLQNYAAISAMLILLIHPLMASAASTALADSGAQTTFKTIDANHEPLPEKVRLSLEKLASAQGFDCSFKQIIFYGDGSKQAYSGTLVMAKPGKFRWQYKTPYEQLYVSNGKGIWFYEPDLMQAQWMTSLDAVDPVIMRFLEGSLSTDSVHILPDEGLPGIYHIKLADGPTLWLALSESGNPQWLESEDALGNRNRMVLDNMNFALPKASVFVFEPPEGVEVIEYADQIEINE
ncbi:MAG: hypothetical protein CO186_12905 [Zetaproteobacteria bacterium CG_4_9_14_3_um_filter_49_83]|nr:MAG: hypothetical protein AUJ56_09705 [Zetaproteobacteria bacterium CG1_02_49_23]PIQ33557.1 MAG: hypothetical protein COW62_04815 [Zetaproteobacteria bacterium CG17_big_fil_post_rev_8_21_14_2_50_50_13]PIV29775.1 MAG: hypothetical protein COS35_10250 [Zetaproteobacteria bacterium CG02_land_8_20_14_3_00_50_9]PIY56539.1 MAG: hypothetical protein COZ00_03695 [Zetaproteobacteria bacterium CG_4_10_14_0_8_um_filter_49_80]PJA33721.1 MAG: hypothetical protein CO186_12905 [Zetaproteobacteria bacterium